MSEALERLARRRALPRSPWRRVGRDSGSAADTDWSRIVALYDLLLVAEPTPIVALNRAVAIDDPSIRLLAHTAHDENVDEHRVQSIMTLRAGDENEARYRDRLRREIDVPVSVIQDRLGARTFTYAYPYGDVNEPAIDLLRRQDVRLGVTVTPGGNALPRWSRVKRQNGGSLL